MLFDMKSYYYDPVLSGDDNGIWSVNIYEYSHGKSRICSIVSGSTYDEVLKEARDAVNKLNDK